MSTDAKSMTEACAAAARTGPEHESLARFAGSWRAEVKLWMDPAGAPQVSRGTMTNRMVLGGRFLQQEYRDDSGLFEGRGFWGYNHVDKRFEGFWIDSMATFFHIEHGRHDAASDTYTMAGTLTDPSSGKPLTKRSVIKVKGPDEHTLEMFFQSAAGPELKSMQITYQRA